MFYSTYPIREQGQRGDWDFRLEAVYTIGILNFVFDEDKNSKDYFHHEVKLMDVNTKEVFYDKLTFVLKNLSRLLERPAALQERVFTRFFLS